MASGKGQGAWSSSKSGGEGLSREVGRTAQRRPGRGLEAGRDVGHGFQGEES